MKIYTIIVLYRISNKMKEFYSLISTTEVNNSHVNEEDVSQTSHGAKTSTGIYRKESIYKQY